MGSEIYYHFQPHCQKFTQGVLSNVKIDFSIVSTALKISKKSTLSRLLLSVALFCCGLEIYWFRSLEIEVLGSVVLYNSTSFFHAAACTLLVGLFDKKSYWFASLSTLILITAFEFSQLFEFAFYSGQFDLIDIIFGAFGVILGLGLLKITEFCREREC